MRKTVFMRRKFWWSAAAILILFGTAGYFHFSRPVHPELVKLHVPLNDLKNDVPPGTNKAVLTLSNGSSIILDSARNGTLARQGDSKIIKTDSGSLSYKALSNPADPSSGSALVSYNTLSTPRGGQYQVTLGDGTKVWLNAASSIRYPTAFTGRERNVEITGEVYFEVAKDVGKPFRVKSGNEEVEVLGTHFNVMAYEDEAFMRTTLLEGSVRLIHGNESRQLKPGQQAQIPLASVDGNGERITVTADADLDEVMAWKNGHFHFGHVDLAAVLRQISRWYDVDVIYEGKKPEEYFGGDIEKNLNLSQVLSALEKSQVHFRIEGKKLIVIP